MSELLTKLQNQFPDFSFKSEHKLAQYTTVKIGGPAEVFFEAKDQSQFTQLLAYAKKNNIDLTMIGWGANVLISDKGIRGLVIRNVAGEIRVLDENIDDRKVNQGDTEEIQARWDSDSFKGTFKYEFKDLDYDETNLPRVLVEIDAGVSLNKSIVSLINQGITGLQWYARIPSTIGGAIYNNIHGGTHFLSEVLESVTVMNENGEINKLNKEEVGLGYDESRFHHSNEIIISAKFNLFKGDADKAKYVVKEWTKRKSIQPYNSIGCTFKNISNEDKKRLDYPTTSVGYIVEHILGLKGYRIGDAKVSEYHCAFIENTGLATAEDYLNVIKKIINNAKTKTGLKIIPEIFFLGFEKSELEGIVS